ncbi:MAG: hypothetical protein LBU51_09220 [Bacteroidales bacterium]|jgi:hypothetical protein|nr:hypothetical protein [Bacteroidales bacterium]
MNQFDDLVKEKLEEEKHPFKRDHWRSFCRAAGLSVPLSTFAILLLCFSTTFLLGAGSFAIWRINKSNGSSAIESHATFVKIDTANHIDHTIIVEEIEQAPQQTVTNNSAPKPAAKKTVSETPSAPQPSSTSKIETHSTIKSGNNGMIIGKPSIISIDTIPSEN